jgi:hypothetical protein
MLSVLFCSRAKDNPDSDLPRLLGSAADCLSAAERRQIEFLIKFDSDDDARVPDHELAKYPFAVRPFCWSRGEGRHGLHHAQEYLFAQRDARSRFCLMTADDFFFNRAHFVDDVLAIRDEFAIIGHNRPPIESYAGVYEQEAMIRQWVVAFGSWSPVITARLIEVCQNFGWQANVDSWLMGLSVVLYDLYKIVLWKTVPSFYGRGGSHVRPASVGAAPTYNNMEITNNVGPINKYWFELVRRQARNVYLNMEHGTDFRKLSWGHGPRSLWRKVREQPLHRLPGRAVRRLLRDIRVLLA